MKRLLLLVVTLLIAGVAAIAIGVAAANRNDNTVRMGTATMVHGSREVPGWWNDSWQSMRGPMMMGRWAGSATSEPEYLAEMVAHHQEAVAAARELSRSPRPEMLAFGDSIVATQSAQIEQMRSWLGEWYPDLSTTVGHRPTMRDLSGLSGDRLDRVFLQDMIGHHMVAVAMSQHLLWRGVEHEQVASLARSIRDGQHSEIIQMQRWLARWF